MIDISIPVIKKDVFIFKKKLNDELLLRTKYALDHRNFKLNATAKKYFELCDGKNTCREITNIMKETFPDIPMEIIQKDFKQTLQKLHKRGVIQWKNGINAFKDEMEEYVDTNTLYHICDYNEAENLLAYNEKMPINYISPYYGNSVFNDTVLIETYVIYNNMFIFQMVKDKEVVCEILCESNYIDFSVQIASLSYDNLNVTDGELVDFFKWILKKIISMIKPDLLQKKKYLFIYVNEEQKKYSFLNSLTYHGILEKEIRGQSDISCYTFYN